MATLMTLPQGLLLTLGSILLLLMLVAFVGGLKRLGCIDHQACPPVLGLAFAGFLLVGLRLVV